jgi:hypothetical protein
MKDLVKSNLWMPEIMKISSLLNEKRKRINSNNKNNHSFWDIYKKSDSNSSLDNKKGACLPMVKSTFVKDSVKYFYWNRYPNMIIDLDWFELNRKTPSNIILIHKK